MAKFDPVAAAAKLRQQIINDAPGMFAELQKARARVAELERERDGLRTMVIARESWQQSFNAERARVAELEKVLRAVVETADRLDKYDDAHPSFDALWDEHQRALSDARAALPLVDALPKTPPEAAPDKG